MSSTNNILSNTSVKIHHVHLILQEICTEYYTSIPNSIEKHKHDPSQIGILHACMRVLNALHLSVSSSDLRNELGGVPQWTDFLSIFNLF